MKNFANKGAKIWMVWLIIAQTYFTCTNSSLDSKTDVTSVRGLIDHSFSPTGELTFLSQPVLRSQTQRRGSKWSRPLLWSDPVLPLFLDKERWIGSVRKLNILTFSKLQQSSIDEQDLPFPSLRATTIRKGNSRTVSKPLIWHEVHAFLGCARK